MGGTSIFMIADELARAYMIITSDVPRNDVVPGQDDYARSVSVNVRGSSNLQNAGVNVIMRDDLYDDIIWDNQTASGHFRWWWTSCCTDGVLLGPFPLNYTMHFEFDTALMVGIDSVHVWSFNYTSGDVDEISFHANSSAVDSDGMLAFSIEGDDCAAFCALQQT